MRRTASPSRSRTCSSAAVRRCSPSEPGGAGDRQRDRRARRTRWRYDRDPDRGGVGYSLTVPAGVAERLPAAGSRVSLWTELVVKEDGWSLFGFDRPAERVVFQRLLGASGFGPKLALALLSALGPERTVRSILTKDLVSLSSVGGIGKKKAERLVLELRDRFGALSFEAPAAARRRRRGRGARARRTRVWAGSGGRGRAGRPGRRGGAGDSAIDQAGAAAARYRPGRALIP